MKIAFLITKSNFGGAQRYVHDLAVSAQSSGHDVVVIAGGDGPLFSALEIQGIRTIAITSLARDVRIRNEWHVIRELITILDQERPDILHTNSSKAGGLGAIAARISNTRDRFVAWKEKRLPHRIGIVFTGHGWAFNEARPDRERVLIGLVHWGTIMLSDRTIAVSRKTRDDIVRFPLPWGKIIVIPNGIAPKRLTAKKTARESLLPGSTEHKDPRIWIGSLAELHPNKGLLYALDGIATIARQASTPFLWIIAGEGEERPRLEQRITELGLENHVVLAGWKDDGERLLSAFDIFLLPSVTEAFPYAVLEAGVHGIPTVATAVGGVPEIIDDMESGVLIHPKNPGEVARAILFLLDHPDRRKAFGASLKERIHDRFSLQQCAAHTFAVYEDIRIAIESDQVR